MFEKEMFRNIDGINLLCKKIPNFYWGIFHDVLEFRWYKEFDYEEWYDRCYFEMKMSSIDGKEIALFKFEDAHFIGDLTIRGWLSGFEIINKSIDYQTETYEVTDYEEGFIHMQCSNFSVRLLQANDERIEEM